MHICEFDQVEFFQVASSPETSHYSNGLAIQHSLPDTGQNRYNMFIGSKNKLDLPEGQSLRLQPPHIDLATKIH